MGIEIERKFLVGEVPEEAHRAKLVNIRQAYLSVDEDREIRIRQANKKCSLTIKTGSGLQRQENETTLSMSQFESLWKDSHGLRIQKQRFLITIGGYTAELDVYQGALAGLHTVEVEFSNMVAAAGFKAPYWFGPEVTGNPRFSNKKLAGLTEETAKRDLACLLLPPMQSYGVIPITQINKTRQVVLISTKTSNRWIFPKGSPEAHLSPQETALAEGLEEAGVEGTIVGKALNSWYWRDTQCYRISYFPMAVSHLRNKWQEGALRARKIVEPAEARKLLDNPSFVRAMDQALLKTI